MTDDPIIQRIESFRCRSGQLLAQRRNRGYTLNRASPGALVARFGPSCVHGTGGTVTLWWNGCRLRTGRGWSVFGARPHIVKGKRTTKAGVVYPQIELGGDTGAVKAFAQAAEGLGYDHIVIYDHVLGAVHAGREPKLTGPYRESDPFHEPLVTYAYLAGVTKKLGLATGVIILPQRQTALFAKQAADVDLFSDGRLRLGVGVGWNWVEYDGLEMSRHFRRRGKRQEQQIALIRKLWEQPVIDHEDSDHRIDRAGILPRPKRSIPIWLGGFSEAAYDRAARIGDGFMFSGRAQTEAVQIKARITARLRELGRDVDAFGFESIQQYTRGDNQWPGDIAAWREAGGSHISVVTMGANLTTVDGHIEAIRRWRDVYNSVR